MVGEFTIKEIHQHEIALQSALAHSKPFPQLPQGGEYMFLSAGIMVYVGEALARLADMMDLRARTLPAQDLFMYRNSVSRQPRVCIVLSRTGDVTDNERAVTMAKKDEVADSYVGVIGEAGGPLVDLVDTAIECHVFESSVATTSTLSAMVLAGISSLASTVDDTALTKELLKVPEVVSGVIESYDRVARRQAEIGFDQIVFLGSGPFYGLARAAALSAFEMSLVSSAGFHTIVYPHGHKVNLTKRSLVTFFLSDSGRHDELKILAEVCRMGARTVVIGDRLAGVESDVCIDLECGLSEVARMALYPAFAQLLGYHAALAKGLDPDHPPQLSKVF